MAQQQFVVVGSNRGIGLEIARILTKRGDAVVGACRNSSSALAATGATVVEGIDVAAADCGQKLRAALGPSTRVDALVVVAGILRRVGLDEVGSAAGDAGILEQIQVNALGPLRIVAALKDALANPSKVALITSRMGSIDDNTSGGHYGYRMSKAALNMAAKSLSVDLKDRGVSVEVLHPGFVRTDLTGGRGDIDAKEAAAQLVARIDEMSLAHSGRFRHANGSALPW